MDYLTVSDDQLPVIYGPNKSPIADVSEALHHLRYILNDVDGVKDKFFRLGFHLDEFRRKRYYLDLGFSSLEEFALANLGMDKTAVSRCIAVFNCFNSGSVDGLPSGRTMYISDRYKEYSYSQLVEMCSMSPDQRKLVSSDMSVKEIRELKKNKKNNSDPIGTLQKMLHGHSQDCETLSKNDNVSQVATSQQKKILSKNDIMTLNGSAFTMKLRYADPICIKSLILCDSDGKLISFGNHLCCLLFESDTQVVLRLLPGSSILDSDDPDFSVEIISPD